MQIQRQHSTNFRVTQNNGIRFSANRAQILTALERESERDVWRSEANVKWINKNLNFLRKVFDKLELGQVFNLTNEGMTSVAKGNSANPASRAIERWSRIPALDFLSKPVLVRRDGKWKFQKTGRSNPNNHNSTTLRDILQRNGFPDEAILEA